MPLQRNNQTKLYTQDELDAAILSAQTPLLETIDNLLTDVERLHQVAISLGATADAE